MTPGSSHASSPYHPSTPSRDTQDMLGNQDWYSPEIEVVIKDSHDDTGMRIISVSSSSYNNCFQAFVDK